MPSVVLNAVAQNIPWLIGGSADLAPSTKTHLIAVEQASTLGWAKYVGESGAIIGMEIFRASAPLKALRMKFGFTPERIVTVAKEQLAANLAH